MAARMVNLFESACLVICKWLGRPPCALRLRNWITKVAWTSNYLDRWFLSVLHFYMTFFRQWCAQKAGMVGVIKKSFVRET
ncbi:hypothetical protein SAMN05216325_102223 [Nitrosomonas marina]|uniref:Uncharacterized protein n=1 Tax=Nitrosomonas marina TaxID=917 RepID=A0A1H8BDV4_9PROT|nr:hypothetical protein SAMN05216325_102223 [Nitrosomonas marina]